MSESVTRFLTKNGGNLKAIITLVVAIALYYTSLELLKSQVEATAIKLEKIEAKTVSDHDILVELRTDMKILKEHVLNRE